MVYVFHLLLSTKCILLTQTSCGALYYLALLVLVHVQLLLSSCHAIIHLRYRLLDLHPTTYETFLHPYKLSSSSVSSLQFLILHRLSQFLSLLGLSPRCLGLKLKIHLQLAIKKVGQWVCLESEYSRPSHRLT